MEPTSSSSPGIQPMHLCACVREERGDGEGADSQERFPLSDTLRYAAPTDQQPSDFQCKLSCTGSVCRVDLEIRITWRNRIIGQTLAGDSGDDFAAAYNNGSLFEVFPPALT